MVLTILLSAVKPERRTVSSVELADLQAAYCLLLLLLTAGHRG
jgi:hypothetical protein